MTVEDLCLVGTSVSDVGCFVVGPQAFGRQPQKLPCSLHNVLRLRGGGGDVSDAGSVVLGDEAAGSGVGDDSSSVSEGGSDAVSVASAGVLARDEVCISRGVEFADPVFDHVLEPEMLFNDLVGRNRMQVSHVFDHVVEQEKLFESIVGRNRRADLVFSLFSAKPSHDCPEFRARLFSPPATPGNDSSASSARRFHVVDKDQAGNRGQPSALRRGAFSVPSGNKVDAGGVNEEFAARSPVASSSVARSPVVSSSVARSPVASSSVARSPVASSSVARSPVVSSSVARSPVASSSVARSPVARPFVVQSPSVPNPVSRRPVLSRSSSLDVEPPSVGDARVRVSEEEDRLHIDRLQFLGLED